MAIAADVTPQRGKFKFKCISHAATIIQRYEQFWYKPIPHDFAKLILNQWSLNDRKWLHFVARFGDSCWYKPTPQENNAICISSLLVLYAGICVTEAAYICIISKAHLIQLLFEESNTCH